MSDEQAAPGDECETPAEDMPTNPDPSNTADIDSLTADLDPDDDVGTRVGAINAQLPAPDRGEH